MTDFISIAEAAHLTGKSETTIRNLLRQTDAGLPKNCTKLRQKGKRKVILVSKGFILSHYGIVDAENETELRQTDANLRQYVALLENQIREKDSQINSLHERVREMNHIIEGMRQDNRLLLTGRIEPVNQDNPDLKRPEPVKNETWTSWVIRKMSG